MRLQSKAPADKVKGLLLAAIGLAILTAFLSPATLAQDYVLSNSNAYPTSPKSGDLGYVDTASGDLHLEIPIGSFPQRATSKPLTISLVYDSAFWTPSGGTWSAPYAYAPSFYPLSGGWHEMMPVVLSMKSGILGGYTNEKVGSCTHEVNYYFTEEGSGATHYFPINTYWGTGCSGSVLSGDAMATDSSGYHMYVTNGGTMDVYAPDGTNLGTANPGPSCSFGTSGYICLGPEDSNGNFIQYWNNTGIFDELGRSIATTSSTSSGCPTSECVKYAIMNSEGSTSTYTMAIESIAVKTKFSQSGVAECSTNCDLYVVQSIALPDGSGYSFKYDCDPNVSGQSAICGSPTGQTAYYGELLTVTLPTGGTLTYTYSNFLDSCSNEHRWLTYRTTPQGGAWTYTPHVISACSSTMVGCQQSVTVVDPNATTEVTTYTWNNALWPAEIQDYSGAVSSANLVETTANTFDFSNTCTLYQCHGASYIRPTASQQTLAAASGANITKQTKYSYDSPQNGNVTGVEQWGYYAGTSPSFPSTPDRATYYTYANIGGTNNINRPQTITTCNNAGSSSSCPGGGSIVSQRTITYDGAALQSITGVANHDDANFGTTYTTRGNPTEISDWVDSSHSVNTSMTYDTTGQVLTQTDPAGNSTTFSYANSFFNDAGNGSAPSSYSAPNPTNAYPTSVTFSITGTETFGYYYGTGKEAFETDQNGDTVYSHFYDPDDRPTATTYPSGWNLTNYSSTSQVDSYDDVADTTGPSSGCSSCRHFQDTLDSWGRQSAHKLVNAACSIETDTTYDLSERVFEVSQPYCSSPVYETYYYNTDPFDRLTTQVHPDGDEIQYKYGNSISASQYCSTSTYGVGYPVESLDENFKARITWQNGFGEAIETDEPDGNGGLSQNTCYTYDALGDLTGVAQGSETRTYAYDGLGRLTQETTPEAGTISLYYTNLATGALCSGDTTDVCNKVSPTPDQQSASNTTTTTYCYDAIGRITQKAYTSQSCPMSSPTVSYAYDQGGAAADAIGRLTYMSDPSGSETYTYDTTHRMGWIAQVQKLVGSTTYTTSYGYDASGDMTQITYPSGRVVQQGYNQIGQLCAVATSANSGCGTVTGPYASGYGYNPAGQVLDFTYGNGVYASMGYSTNRSQLNCLDYSTTNRGANCTHDATTLFGLTYYYQNDPTNCTTGASYNNGQIQCIADAVDAGRSVAYTYDAWGRLNTALTAGDASYPQWGLSETYDRYGNRRCQNVTAGSGPYVACMNYTNNQPPGYTFDAAGNMITEPLNPVNNYGYDARNRMTSSAGNGGTATYTYDDNDDRVQKSISGGTSTVYIYSGDEDIAEYDNGAAPGSPSREYVYGNSQLLTQIDSSGTHYFHQDQLSPRLITDSTGAVTGQQGHFPFGEPWYSSNGSGEWVFTTYQRNSENGLDYALARFYDSRVASFCSADPIEGRPGDPQSWNRYAYGGNDPIDITDPNGQSWWAWLIDAIIGAAAVILPEVDPGLLPFLTGSSTISGTVTTGSLGIDAGTGYLESVTNVATFSSTVDWGILAADSGAAVAAQGAQSPPHPTPEQKFTNCVSTYGNENAKNNLTYQGYQDAQQAARAAKIPASDELALWNNENSLNLNFPPVPPTGEVGPIQIRPGVVSDLKAANSLPPGWDSDPVANLTAGALYFGKMLQRVGESRAAAAYNAGVRGERLGRGNPYQKAYNQAKSMANNIINCMH